MKSIIIIGYMGAGKTSVGKTLAKKLGYDFYDLDWFIEERFHTRIPDLFKEKGEDAFRDIERRMLHETAEFEEWTLGKTFFGYNGIVCELLSLFHWWQEGAA